MSDMYNKKLTSFSNQKQTTNMMLLKTLLRIDTTSGTSINHLPRSRGTIYTIFIASVREKKVILQKQRKWQNIVKDLFDEMDIDKDGKLSIEEVKAAIPYSEFLEDIDDEVQLILEEADTDGNGFIELSEFKKMINETAETLDTFDKRLGKRYGSVKY